MTTVKRQHGKFTKKVPSKRGINLTREERRKPEHTAHIDHDYLDQTDIGLEVEIGNGNTAVDTSWQVGRRIVELNVLAERMFCCQCNVPLHLQDTGRKERRF